MGHLPGDIKQYKFTMSSSGHLVAVMKSVDLGKRFLVFFLLGEMKNICYFYE